MHEADHTPPSSVKGKNWWSYTSAPPICLNDMDSDSFVSTPTTSKGHIQDRSNRLICELKRSLENSTLHLFYVLGSSSGVLKRTQRMPPHPLT